jgi:hypothetical protein
MTRARQKQWLLGTALMALSLSLADMAHAQCPQIPMRVDDPATPAGAPAPIPRPSPSVGRVPVGPAASDSPGYCLYQPPTRNLFSDTLIVYIHGAQFGLNSDFPQNGGLDAMMQTLASFGYHVLYPDVTAIATPGFPLFPDWPSQTTNAMTRGLNQLRNQGNPISHLVVAGFSLGARAAPRVAALWTGTPSIELVVAHDPAGQAELRRFDPLRLNGAPNFDVTRTALARVPGSTYLLVVQSNQLAISTDRGALDIFNNLPQIPRFRQRNGVQVPQKNFLRIRSDSSHGTPTGNRISFHASIEAMPPPFSSTGAGANAVAITQLTSIDTNGYLRPLIGSAFEAVFGDTLFGFGYSPLCNERGTGGRCSQTRSMDVWADGIPATPMLNAGDLCLFSEPGCVPLS